MRAKNRVNSEPRRRRYASGGGGRSRGNKRIRFIVSSSSSFRGARLVVRCLVRDTPCPRYSPYRICLHHESTHSTRGNIDLRWIARRDSIFPLFSLSLSRARSPSSFAPSRTVYQGPRYRDFESHAGRRSRSLRLAALRTPCGIHGTNSRESTILH